MIDRIASGYVIDFIDFRLINFWVFNVADSFVCIGCGLLILSLILGEIKSKKTKKESQDPTESEGAAKSEEQTSPAEQTEAEEQSEPERPGGEAGE